MPVVGRPPKPQGTALNKNKPVHDWIEVADKPYAGPRPSLPPTRTITTQFGLKDIDLRELTHAWWDAVSTMPHCLLWTPSDWSFALATAIVADAAYCGGVGAATELRNREKVMGTTVDYRRALRIRYVEPKPVKVAEGAALDDYRDL